MINIFIDMLQKYLFLMQRYNKYLKIEKARLIDMINKALESSVSVTTQTPETSAYSAIKNKRF